VSAENAGRGANTPSDWEQIGDDGHVGGWRLLQFENVGEGSCRHAHRHPICSQSDGVFAPRHAFSALTAWRRAREVGGRFLLRLEDIDRFAVRPRIRDAILEDLAWLGLDWDGPVRVQSEHLDHYAPVLEQLRAEGAAVPVLFARGPTFNGRPSPPRRTGRMAHCMPGPAESVGGRTSRRVTSHTRGAST